MRILLDECAPRPLKRELADYEIRTVVEMGWSGKKNGELLLLMSQEIFTILLTTDQNLRYQQNLQQAGVALVFLVALSNRLPDLLPLVPDARNVLNTITPGEVIEVGGSLKFSRRRSKTTPMHPTAQRLCVGNGGSLRRVIDTVRSLYSCEGGFADCTASFPT